MNKWIICGTIVATSLMAHAETVSVRFATPMTAGKTIVPAGDYTLATVSPGVMVLKGESLRVFVFGRVVDAQYSKPTVELDNVKRTESAEPLKLASTK